MNARFQKPVQLRRASQGGQHFIITYVKQITATYNSEKVAQKNYKGGGPKNSDPPNPPPSDWTHTNRKLLT